MGNNQSLCVLSYLIIIIAIIISVACIKKDSSALISSETRQVSDPPGWELIWNDEFDDSSIDLNKWEFQIGDGCDIGICGWGNNELQWYQLENARLGNGYLIIAAKEEQMAECDYTSARMRTKNKRDWTYGRFDIRAKLPFGQGIWPAIWMLPTDEVFGGWAASGEIDIMELVGHEPHIIYGNIHYGGEWPNNIHTGASDTLSSGTFADDFHLFSLEWEETEMRWYVDGRLFQRQTQWNTENGNYPAPFNQHFHLILNIAVGGNWPGQPDSSTIFPQEMYIDFVRVYNKTG